MSLCPGVPVALTVAPKREILRALPSGRAQEGSGVSMAIDSEQLCVTLEKLELAIRRTEMAVSATDMKLGYLMGALGDEIARVIAQTRAPAHSD
jgi:hypothetical protein